MKGWVFSRPIAPWVALRICAITLQERIGYWRTSSATGEVLDGCGSRKSRVPLPSKKAMPQPSEWTSVAPPRAWNPLNEKQMSVGTLQFMPKSWQILHTPYFVRDNVHAMATTAYSYIRFSTPEQMFGDSLRRQMESSLAYAEAHGLTLDTTLNLRDLGISAFRGANVEKGRLGAFIKAIDEGLVAKGSYLLVESLDRLSRAEVMDAMEVFLAIVNREIVIVTMLDGRV